MPTASNLSLKAQTPESMRRIEVLIILLLLAVLSCRRNPSPADPVYLDALSQWKTERLEALKTPDGWLALAGLFWLQEGENTFGSDSSNQVVFPSKAPAKMGVFYLEGDSVRMVSEPDMGIRLAGKEGEVVRTVLTLTGEDGPAVLQWHSLDWVLLERGGKYGIRLWDRETPLIQSLDSIPAFPVDPEWKVEATLIPAKKGRTVTMQNVLGMTIEQASAGVLRFEKGGKTYELEALEDQEGFFLIFSDETSGSQTYGGGRYLYVPGVNAQGKTWIDFNKSENPPCAFTRYATCLLPPAQNRLEVAVTAGELAYGAH